MNKRQRKRLRKQARREALAVQQQQGTVPTQPGEITISVDGDGATAPNIPQRADRNRNVARVTTAYSFSGPLPPPELLGRYNDVVPNGAERIIKMAENQQTHRQELERTVVHGNVESEKRGQWMGLTIASLVLACGFVLVFTGHPVSGSAISIADVATLAGVFVYGKRAQRQELDGKKEPFKK